MENKEYYKKLFPLLTEYELIYNSESEKYNCISHTLNINDDIIRATISSIEIFLISLFTKDPDILRNELKKTTEWNRYESIRDFDPEQLSNHLINDYKPNNVIRMLNIFNKINNINFILKNESDILRYFKGWKKYLNRVSEKMYSKIEKKIIEISNKEPYGGEIYETHEDKNILSYEDHRKKNRRERNLSYLLSINVNDFL
jgi:hypothetical protein